MMMEIGFRFLGRAKVNIQIQRHLRHWNDALDEIVGGSIEGHASSDGTEISVNLGVTEPVEGKEEEDGKSIAGTADFTNKLVIPGDTLRD